MAGTRKNPKDTPDVAGGPPPVAEPGAADVVTPELVEQELTRTGDAARELAAAGAAAAPPARVGEAATDSSVTDELSGGGVAFGDFVKSVGLAVAAAQTELDNNLTETAKKLSETQIDVVAVFEQVTKDEDGSMDKGIVHMQKLPLINYLMPTAYHWSRVYLEADMSVQEFNSRSGFNIQQKSFSVGASTSFSAGMFGASGSGSAGFNVTNSSTGVDASNSLDLAAGKLHMEATLEPRSDVELPKPFILQKGPKLDVQVGAKTQKFDANDQTKVVGYEVKLTARLAKLDGSPNSDKPLSVTLSDPSLIFTSPGKTDTNGEMVITVNRTVTDPANDKPVQVLVRTTFGLVTSTVGVAL